MRWSCPDCNIWSHKRTSTYARPAATFARETTVHLMDDWSSNPSPGDYCWCKVAQALQSIHKQQSSDAAHPWHVLRLHQRHPLRPFPTRGQICSRAACSHNSGPAKSIQSMAILDDPARPRRSCPLSTLLPPSWLETLFNKHSIPIRFLHIQYHRYSRRADLLPPDLPALHTLRAPGMHS